MKKPINFVRKESASEKPLELQVVSKIVEKINELPLYDVELMASDSGSYYFSKWCDVQVSKQKKIVTNKKVAKEGTNLYDVYKKRFQGTRIAEDAHFSTVLYFSLYNELAKKIDAISEKRKVYPSEVVKWENSLLKKWEKATHQLKKMTFSTKEVARGEILNVFPYLEIHIRNNRIIFADDLLTAEFPLNGDISEPDLLMDIVKLSYQTENDFTGVFSGYMIPAFHHRMEYKGKKVDVHIRTKLTNYSFIFHPKTQKYTRMNGQEIYTYEGLVYEMKELERRSSEDRIKRMETAYEMFASTLSESQEKMMREMDLVLLEGDEYYYFASTKATSSYLCRFKKEGVINLASIEKFEAMCIHPESYIPVFDGMASINLHLMSGEEKYITKNANPFILRGAVKTQIENFFKVLEEKKISFNGLQTIEALY